MEINDSMTMEEIISGLYEEYGEDFNWHIIPFAESNGSFVYELKKELNSRDAFILTGTYAVAKCDSNDDVLFLNANNVWRIYHLTYSAHNETGFPKYIEFPDRKAVGLYIQKRYIEEYL